MIWQVSSQHWKLFTWCNKNIAHAKCEKNHCVALYKRHDVLQRSWMILTFLWHHATFSCRKTKQWTFGDQVIVTQVIATQVVINIHVADFKFSTSCTGMAPDHVCISFLAGRFASQFFLVLGTILWRVNGCFFFISWDCRMHSHEATQIEFVDFWMTLRALHHCMIQKLCVNCMCEHDLEHNSYL